jgi:hypothetical protein
MNDLLASYWKCLLSFLLSVVFIYKLLLTFLLIKLMFHLFRWWRWWRESILTLILICLNIECDNRSLSLLNARNFQLNIRFRSKNVLFMKLCIAACCNDICCLIRRLSHTSFLHLRWAKMMTIESDLLKDRWTRSVTARYEIVVNFHWIWKI